MAHFSIIAHILARKAPGRDSTRLELTELLRFAPGAGTTDVR
jgi:hypothetical protein